MVDTFPLTFSFLDLVFIYLVSFPWKNLEDEGIFILTLSNL